MAGDRQGQPANRNC